MRWLKVAEIYCLTILKIRRLKSQCPQAILHLKPVGEIFFPCLVLILVACQESKAALGLRSKCFSLCFHHHTDMGRMVDCFTYGINQPG